MMPRWNPTRRTIGAAVLVLAALALVAYASWARLARTPPGGLAVAEGASRGGTNEDEILHWTCPMHPHVQEPGPGRCPECGMELVPVAASPPEQQSAPDDPARLEHTPRSGIVIDTRRQQLLGVRIVPVERRVLTGTLRTVGLVRYDETRLSDVNLKVEGWIRTLHVDSTGAFVRTGQPLFTLYSPALVTTQDEYLLALETRDQLRDSQLADARDHAERLVQSARRRLDLWDLPADQIEKLQRAREAQTDITFRSPVTGYVIGKEVVEGQHVKPGETLYRIANLSTIWVEADVYEQDLARVGRGAAAVVTTDAYPGERFSGKVSFIYPYADVPARTVKVRIALANRAARLKPGMYANVELATPGGTALAVPADALLDSGTEQVVFLARGNGYFEPRRVTAGQRFDDAVEIREGLEEDDLVATGAAFFLDSESQLRSSLQAYDAAPPPQAGGQADGERAAIALRTDPDPPRSGENTLEVEVTTADGRPVTDARVTVEFFMAAMPSMNMPAMRNEATLTHAGDGVYRGTGEVMMAGRWAVTVSVLRDGRRIGSRQFSVVAQ